MRKRSPKPLPEAIIDVSTNFDGDTAQNEAPQNQEEGKIITGEGRSHEPRKYRDQRAAKTHKPHFMPRPQRSDRCNHLPSLLGRSRDRALEDSSAKIAAIQRHVGDQHETDNAIPGGSHTNDSFPRTALGSDCWSWLATSSSSGPRLISRPARKRKSTPSTKYSPTKPIRVKIVSPLLTTLL